MEEEVLTVLTKRIHAFPHCILICEAIESFENVHTTSFEQHRDLRSSSQGRDLEHFYTFFAMAEGSLAFLIHTSKFGRCDFNRCGCRFLFYYYYYYYY